jgi:hypothetical protein
VSRGFTTGGSTFAARFRTESVEGRANGPGNGHRSGRGNGN